MLLGESLKNEEAADAIVKGIATALSAPVDIDGHEVAVNVSVGFSCFPSDGEDAACLIGNAEAALLEPGEGGSSSSRRFAREMKVHSIARFTIGNRLRSAIERQELLLHYQPKVSSATGRITRLEALGRWDPPHDGLLPPAPVIPVAEGTGLVRR